MRDYTKFNPDYPPPPLMTSEPGSFAYNTMTTRKRSIIKDVLADHTSLYPPTIIAALEALYEELIEAQPIQPLETLAPDGDQWRKAWKPHQGHHWLDVPWYFAETFFYRRLIEATCYFGCQQTEENPLTQRWIGVDPFLPRKREELEEETTWQVLAAALEQISEADPQTSFRYLLHYALWGNRMDLSYTEVMDSNEEMLQIEEEQENLVIDDTETVLEHLQVSDYPTPFGQRVDFLCDNSGTELLLDLLLVDFLFRTNWAEVVVFHVKAHPTYVSDTIPADVDITLRAMETHPQPEISALATRLKSYRDNRQFWIRSHFFWNSSLFFWEIPSYLKNELAQASLVISKGDANYRRFLGDSRWPTTVPLADAVPYFPAPLVALRTLKSEPIVGLEPGQAEKLDQQDDQWRVNGKRGLIQALL